MTTSSSIPEISILSSDDEELVSILEELQISKTNNADKINSSRLTGYFCSDTVFNLSQKLLSETEIKRFRFRNKKV